MQTDFTSLDLSLGKKRTFYIHNFVSLVTFFKAESHFGDLVSRD